MIGGEKVLIAFATVALVLFLVDRVVSYYGAVLGLLQYMGEKWGAVPSAERVKQLRDEALKRRAGELLGRR